MKLHISSLTVAALGGLTLTASAQAPDFISLSTTANATDVSTVGDVIVVGNESSIAGISLFRWTNSTGEVYVSMPGGGASSTPVRISTDGLKILATDFLLGNEVAAIFDGTTWTTLPTLPGSSGGVRTLAGGISATGNFAVGMGYSASNAAHPFKWSQSTGLTTDLQPFFSSPQSRAFDVSADGNTIVGWEDNPTRNGTRWVNGVKTAFTYLDPTNVVRNVGSAQAVNDAGTIAVGNRIYGIPVQDVGWRWDAGTNLITPLLPPAGVSGTVIVNDLSEDGSVIVGLVNAGIGQNTAVVWINNAPFKLYDYLQTLGTTNMGSISGIGAANGVSGNGLVLVGNLAETGPGNPTIGWIVAFPGAIPLGTSYCYGDGAGSACPCGNVSAVGQNDGCVNSLTVAGRLRGIGQAQVSNDSAQLVATNIPNGPGLYFQGTTQVNGGNGNSFGDGLRCAGGTIIRLGIVQGASNASTYPSPNPPAANQVPISLKGLVSPSDVRNYQLWYRDSGVFCTASVFNLTNGLTITWQP